MCWEGGAQWEGGGGVGDAQKCTHVYGQTAIEKEMKKREDEGSR